MRRLKFNQRSGDIFLLLSCIFLFPACQVENYPELNKSPELGPVEKIPSISNVFPRRVSILGGTEITIRGNDFFVTSEVFIGDQKCGSFTYVSPSELRCTPPPLEGIGMWQQLKVVNRNERAGYFYDFSYVTPEEATAFEALQLLDDLESGNGVSLQWRWNFGSFVRKGLAQLKNNLISMSPNHLVQWSHEARLRNEQRQKYLDHATDDDSWDSAESIMNDSIARRYLESMNRLENRYPHAVPNTYILFSKLYYTIEGFKVGDRGILGEMKKAAAIRLLERIIEGEFTADPNRSGLTGFQVLALAWAAVADEKIYQSQVEREDRIWGLLESLAITQRAHNISGETITFDDSEETDSPSCARGTFTRFLEHLDGIHPDVRINIETEVNSSTRLSNSVIISEIRNHHQNLFNRTTHQMQQRIRTGVEVNNVHFSRYVERLRASVLRENPNIPSTQLEELTDTAMMEALFEASE